MSNLMVRVLSDVIEFDGSKPKIGNFYYRYKKRNYSTICLKEKYTNLIKKAVEFVKQNYKYSSFIKRENKSRINIADLLENSHHLNFENRKVVILSHEFKTHILDVYRDKKTIEFLIYFIDNDNNFFDIISVTPYNSFTEKNINLEYLLNCKNFVVGLIKLNPEIKANPHLYNLNKVFHYYSNSYENFNIPKYISVVYNNESIYVDEIIMGNFIELTYRAVPGLNKNIEKDFSWNFKNLMKENSIFNISNIQQITRNPYKLILSCYDENDITRSLCYLTI